MISVTVVNKKDLFLYLIKLLLIIVIPITIFKYFFSFKSNSSNLSFLKYCVGKILPGFIYSTEDNNQMCFSNNYLSQKFQIALNTELEVINSIVDKTTETSTIPESTSSSMNSENIQYENSEYIENEDLNTVSTQVIDSAYNNRFTNEFNKVKIRNETSFVINDEILTPDISINNKNILIFHTHTCESYTPSNNFQYVATGNYRSTDLNFTVSRVGTELKNYLSNFGFSVFHDTTFHDYPAYSGSYGRSLKTVQNLLNTINPTDIVIDIHRDAIGDNTYAPKVIIGNETAAQLMFVIGTNGSRFVS